MSTFPEAWTLLIPGLNKNFWKTWTLVFLSFLEMSGKGWLKPSMYFLPVCRAYSWVVYMVFLGISPLWCSQFKIFFFPFSGIKIDILWVEIFPSMVGGIGVLPLPSGVVSLPLPVSASAWILFTVQYSSAFSPICCCLLSLLLDTCG